MSTIATKELLQTFTRLIQKQNSQNTFNQQFLHSSGTKLAFWLKTSADRKLRT